MLDNMKLYALTGLFSHHAETGNFCPVRDKISVETMQSIEPKSRMGRNRPSECAFKHSVPDGTYGYGANGLLPIFNLYGILRSVMM